MRTRFVLAVALVSACLFGATYSAQGPTAAAKVDFGRDVQPILRQNCYSCHGPTQQKNGFRLDRRRDALRGGTIAVIGPGNAAGSRLYLRLIGTEYGQQMPLTGSLTPQQVATIKAWIDQGAEWPDALAGEAATAPPDPKATRLMNALQMGDRAAFTTMAKADPGVANLKGPGGTTPLMYAALYGSAADLTLLLDAKADPNIKNEAGATALMWAVTDLEKTRALIEHGATVDARSDDGRTPLLIAAGLPNALPVVTLLLDKGANPSAKGPGLLGDTTPLTEAAYAGNEAIFHLLIARGANVAAAGPAPLGLSFRAHCKSCADALLKDLSPEIATANLVLGAPPIGPALATPLMLEHGADANVADEHGRTILMLAAASDALPVDAITALIAKGANVNATSPRGETALGLAKRNGNTPVVDLLTKAGGKDMTPMPGPMVNMTKPMPVASVRAAVERSLPLLQKNDETFLRKAGCVSCHNNTLTAITVSTARLKGLPVNESIARGQARAIGAYTDDWRERALQGIGIPGDADTVSAILLGLAAEKYPADATTDSMVRFLRRQQAANGQWRPLAFRPPLEASDIQATAAAMHAIQAYLPKVDRASYELAVKRGGEWLAQATPMTNEDRAYLLLGLTWAGAAKSAIDAAGKALAATQRADGGWSQIPSLGSDAYATGEALVALAESGAMPASAPAFQRGVKFLLETQYADGSWFVPTRAIPIQPLFDSGFPYGHDSFISAAATNWATRALVLAYTK